MQQMQSKLGSMKPKPFVPTYGGKVGGKMSNGAGWGGEKPTKTKKSKRLPTKSKVMSSLKKTMGY